MYNRWKTWCIFGSAGGIFAVLIFQSILLGIMVISGKTTLSIEGMKLLHASLAVACGFFVLLVIATVLDKKDRRDTT
jgi:hypothetical protein